MTAIFLDTEWSDLHEPNLISVGMVTLSGAECYLELDLTLPDTQDRLRVSSAFVHDVVLAQWGRVDGAACSHQVLGLRAGEWLLSQTTPGNGIEVLSDCLLDLQLLAAALKHGGCLDRVNEVADYCTIEPVLQQASGAQAQEAEWRRVALERCLTQHHALADAFALRAAYIATRPRPLTPRELETLLLYSRRKIAATEAKASLDVDTRGLIDLIGDYGLALPRVSDAEALRQAKGLLKRLRKKGS